MIALFGSSSGREEHQSIAACSQSSRGWIGKRLPSGATRDNLFLFRFDISHFICVRVRHLIHVRREPCRLQEAPLALKRDLRAASGTILGRHMRGVGRSTGGASPKHPHALNFTRVRIVSGTLPIQRYTSRPVD
jgi:hypothetical protein